MCHVTSSRDVQLEMRASRVWTKTKSGTFCCKKRFFGRRTLITDRTSLAIFICSLWSSSWWPRCCAVASILAASSKAASAWNFPFSATTYHCIWHIKGWQLLKQPYRAWLFLRSTSVESVFGWHRSDDPCIARVFGWDWDTYLATLLEEGNAWLLFGNRGAMPTLAVGFPLSSDCKEESKPAKIKTSPGSSTF